MERTTLVFKDQPNDPGMYVCYVNPTEDIPYARKLLLMWIDGNWYYLGSSEKFRDVVYGCFGPLPSMQLVDEDPSPSAP